MNKLNRNAKLSDLSESDIPALQSLFESRVQKSTHKECYKWSGIRGPFSKVAGAGYGRLNFKGYTFSAHRLAYELYNGEIQNGMFVLHSCDNPECSNPKHLFLGTQADNVADRNAKNRANMPKGEEHKDAIFNNLEVNMIRDLIANGTKVKELSALYNVGINTIYRIVRGETYITAGGPTKRKERTYVQNNV